MKSNIKNRAAVEVKESWEEAWLLKWQLRKVMNVDEQDDLELWLELLEFEIELGVKEIAAGEADVFKNVKDDLKLKKKLAEKLCKDRGLPEESALVAAENVLKMFGASREAYHGGD